MKKTLSSILFLSALLVAVISSTALAVFHNEFPFAVYNCLSRTPIYSDEELTDIIGYGEIGDELLIYEELDSAFRIRFNGSFAYVPYGDFMEHDFAPPRGTLDCCTEGAEFIHTCGSCGYEFVEIIPPFEHTWVFQSATVSTSCEDDTSETFVCSACGEEKTEIIPALGHDLEVSYVDGQQITRCRREGCTYEDVLTVPPHDHEWKFESMSFSTNCEDDTSTTYVCTLCGEKKTEVTPAPGHDLEVTYAPLPGQYSICEYGGQKITRCLRDGCTYKVIALVSAGHNFEEVARVEPTFQSSGTATMQCSYCGFREYISIPALVDDGMTDDFFLLGQTYLTGVWKLFGIYVPGFDFTFGGMMLGVALASISLSVLTMIFGIGGHRAGSTPRTSSTNKAKVSKERQGDEK